MSKLDELLGEIRSGVHVTPSPYSAAAYDAFWVAALAENVTMLNEGNHTLKGNGGRSQGSHNGFCKFVFWSDWQRFSQCRG